MEDRSANFCPECGASLKAHLNNPADLKFRNESGAELLTRGSRPQFPKGNIQSDFGSSIAHIIYRLLPMLVFLGWIPVVGPFVVGFRAGYRSRTIGRAFLAGFFVGIIGIIIVAILVTILGGVVGGLLFGFRGATIGALLSGTIAWIVLLVLGASDIIASTAGGLLGGFMRLDSSGAWPRKVGRSTRLFDMERLWSKRGIRTDDTPP